MKYKSLGVLACAVMLLVGAFNWEPLLGGTEGKRVHQHLSAPAKQECTESHTDGTLCTHLPLICIDTGGQEIPGKGITDENGKQLGYTATPDGSDRITASMRVMDSETEYNHTSDEPTVESRIIIHARGNSSRFFAKSGYRVKLIDEDGNNNPQSLLGMDAHHDWVLHGPYLDKTLIRNYMMYNLSGEIMDYAPNVRFCEVVINGEYEGVYVLTEMITAGKDGARLNISVNVKDNTYTGYLLRLDRKNDVETDRVNNLTAYTFRGDSDLKLEVEYPGPEKLNDTLKRAIETDFSRFEKALYSYDFNNKKYGYKNYIDVDSFASYFIIHELVVNYDAGSYSTYIYKDTSGKYRMCVWDFNNACDNYQEQSVMTVQHFELQNKLWLAMLMKDEEFVESVISKYRTLRKTLLSDEYLENYIDSVIDYLGPAIERNNARWAEAFSDDTLLEPADRNLHSYDEAVAQLKTFFRERTAWLDDNIESLKQYSASSKIKKYTEVTD